MRWLKRILITLLVIILAALLLAGFVRFQGIQYTLAYTAGGFTHPLPKADAYATTANGGKNPCASEPINVVSYNIFNGSAFVERMVDRYGEGNIQGFLQWSKRVPEIRERIAEYKPDLVGLQETGWNHDIFDIVSETDYTLVTYAIGGLEYGDSALLFRTARFDMLDHGQLWYGPNPELPLAYGFKRLAVPRYANWVVLKEKDTGFTFFYVNTHFDNNTPNKEPGSKLFRERITALAEGMPMIATGDFNSNGDTERFKTFTGMDKTPPLLQETQVLAANKLVTEKHGEPQRTMLESDTELNYLKRIDHILVGGPCPVTVAIWTIDLRPLKNGERISDHDLMAAQLRFGPG